MNLFLRYMVSIRCKIIVKAEIEKLGHHCRTVQLGEAETEGDLTSAQLKELDVALKKSGLELMDDKKSILVEKIKNVIVEEVHYSEEPLQLKLSTYLGQKLHHSYPYLSNIFSESQGVTIEHFHIVHKIERVKELLVYNELNVSEIARQMGYSSVAHLSNQFKKITGLTPYFFKKIKVKMLCALEDI